MGRPFRDIEAALYVLGVCVTVIPEFSRPLEVERLPGSGKTTRIEADPAEKEALARRFGLLGLETLSAMVTARPMAGGRLVRIEGTLNASVTQRCGVTLEAFSSDLEATFAETFHFGTPEKNPQRDMVFDPESDELPESIEDGKIDIGELVAEHLSLSIDSFPRSPGAMFETPAGVGHNEPDRENPFAALASLRQNKR